MNYCLQLSKNEMGKIFGALYQASENCRKKGLPATAETFEKTLSKLRRQIPMNARPFNA